MDEIMKVKVWRGKCLFIDLRCHHLRRNTVPESDFVMIFGVLYETFATINTEDVVFINDLRPDGSETNESSGKLRYWGERVK